MTKKTPTPTPAHMQKLADLMDMRPEGVTARQVQNTLSVSPTLAKAALIEIGATEVEGKWVFVADVIDFDKPKKPLDINKIVMYGASLSYGVVEPEPVTIDPPKRQIVAPAGATHQNLQDGCFYKAVDGAAYYFSFGAGAWFPCGATAHDLDVAAHVIRLPVKPTPEPVCTTCETKTDIAPLSLTGECQQCYEDATDKAWWDSRGGAVIPDKSDFALALEAERQRVFDAVANGGTVERLAEITGLPVDDVQMHLDVLIDDGAIVERPIIVAMSYRVAT